MTCRPLSAQEALQLRLINSISKTPESVVEECVALATHIASLSPDAIIVTRQGLREAWESSSVKGAATRTADQYRDQLRAGENFRIGVEAFARKTRPQWVPSMI
jgi:enoyl-CoA hydratase/carnithine racemase